MEIIHAYPHTERGCTGFSKLRESIRYGIYLDCDMILLADIAELWAYRQQGARVVMHDGASEVAVNDHPRRIIRAIPGCWNVEDTITPDAKLVHYTALDSPPWFYDNHPSKEAVKLYERYKNRI